MSELDKKYKELINKNAADSYASYLSNNGIRAEEQYYDALANADTVRSTSSSNYGTRADSIFASGLNGSGYEDYLKSKSNANYLASYNKAQRQRSVNEYENRTGYKKYLSDYEALQEKISQSVIKKLEKANVLNFEEAYAEALRSGISRNLAYVTAQSGVLKAIDATMEKALEYSASNNLTAKQARKYALELGLDEWHAEEIYNEILPISRDEKEFYSSLSADEYYEYLKSQAKKK